MRNKLNISRTNKKGRKNTQPKKVTPIIVVQGNKSFETLLNILKKSIKRKKKTDSLKPLLSTLPNASLVDVLSRPK